MPLWIHETQTEFGIITVTKYVWTRPRSQRGARTQVWRNFGSLEWPHDLLEAPVVYWPGPGHLQEVRQPQYWVSCGQYQPTAKFQVLRTIPWPLRGTCFTLPWSWSPWSGSKTSPLAFSWSITPIDLFLFLIMLILWPFLNLVRKDGKNDGLTEGCAAVKTMFFPRVFSRSDVEFVNASHTVLLMDRVAVYRGHSGNSNLLKLSSWFIYSECQKHVSNCHWP